MKVQLNVRVDGDVRDAATARAAELGQPIGVFVERALLQALAVVPEQAIQATATAMRRPFTGPYTKEQQTGRKAK